MTSLIHSFFQTKRRKTEEIQPGIMPTSSSAISLTGLGPMSPNSRAAPVPSHRRQHSAGSVKTATLPPPGPRGRQTRQSNASCTSASSASAGFHALSDLCIQTKNPIADNAVRMVLIEAENRVLYDTATVIPVKNGAVPNVKTMSTCNKFQLLRRRRDTATLSQMVFGAVPSASGSETFKIHTVRDDDKILISKVFFIPRAQRDPNGSSDSDSQSTLKSLDGWTKAHRSTMSTPEAFSRVRHISITFGEDEDGDSGGSIGGSSTLPRAFSPPHRLSRNRRRQMAHKTSLSDTSASLKSRSRLSSVGSQTDDEAEKGRQVAVGLLFPAAQRNFLFQHMPLIESEMSRFESRIMTAALNAPTFLQNVCNAWQELSETLCCLHNAPRLRRPVWLSLNERSSDERAVAAEFCDQLAYLVRRYDTKENGYFVSNLITAVLMHHMSWVASVASPPVRNDARMRQPTSIRNLLFGTTPNEDAHSLGYNAHMAQYLELSGNVGTHRSAKTVIVGDDAEVLSTVCQVLSFFIRCSAVQHIDDDRLWELPIEQAFSPVSAIETPDSIASPPSSVHLAFSPDKGSSDEERFSVRPGPSSSIAGKSRTRPVIVESSAAVSPSSSIGSLPSVVTHSTAICVVETDTASSITIIDRFEYPCCGTEHDDEMSSSTELWSPRGSNDGLGRSLFAGPLAFYCPHFVVSAIVKSQVRYEEVLMKIYDEVRCADSASQRVAATASLSSSQSSSSVCDVQMPENVIILADINEKTVKVVSSEGFDDVTSPSEAVVSMLEQFVDIHTLCSSSNPHFLVSIIEDSLAHIVGKSLSLVEMVAREPPPKSTGSTDLSPERVRSIVGCDHSDLRLIVNVAAVYWPPVLSSVFG